ncbi:hypothetical protein CK203_063142 [Vitis vinifera]|uniref:Uncharacterized protein n=1 Tax=Vitis vinifera TaxID=29760 RepID=A0A438FRH6_VITVI|nr:hypothetical protein CK203_063142 [Vitis vinifera]
MTRASPNSINQRLDDMFSMFSPHIINYEPPRGFVVPKFTMYNGMSDPFDHIMHFRNLMTLDIGNGALMCKIFKRSISPGMPFFESIAKKPPITMDDLFSISYERLLPHIRDLSDFRSEPIKKDPDRRDWNRRCSYHKDHDHTHRIMQEFALLGGETYQGRTPKIVCSHNHRAKRDDVRGNRPSPCISGSSQSCH